jgi:exopolysaccharide biosynthesis WecB/TagA/CpsF family protein
MNPTRVRIFYPADPVGVVPGGIDTFLRGMIQWAPQDIQFSLVGMTTDLTARPVFQWSEATLGTRTFDCFPVVHVGNAGTRGRIPLSVQYIQGLRAHRAQVRHDFEIFDFHRLEPSLLFESDLRPKNAYFHQDPEFVRLSASDNLWKHMPGIYEKMEGRAMRAMASAWCVRESGVAVLRKRYPQKAERLQFIPTWVDTDLFHPVATDARLTLRSTLAATHQLPLDNSWIVTVGRLDTQKDPFLMLEAFSRLRARGHMANWLVVGDGVLRAELERAVQAAGLSESVHFLGLQAPQQIANILRASDAYALSSAYEGMPMALLEALGSGLPVVTTEVGEVRKVMREGINGLVCTDRNPEGFAQALEQVLTNSAHWDQQAIQTTVHAFHPSKVLQPAYDNYRMLGAPQLAARSGWQQARSQTLAQRRTCKVLGIPIDVLSQEDARTRIMQWAQTRQSRTVCFVNVHSVVQAGHDERHYQTLWGADLTAPDGAPVAWSLRAKGNRAQPRVDGPGTMWQLCADAQAAGVSIGLYGSTDATLAALVNALRSAFPQLTIGYVYSPPFRELTAAEEQQVCDAIQAADVGLLFVGLGCPKQEFWAARMRGRIPAVMLGVGAAFEFHAGVISRAPQWMRQNGMEWLHRLLSEPRRLGKRYLVTNSVFLGRSAAEACKSLFSSVLGR